MKAFLIGLLTIVLLAGAADAIKISPTDNLSVSFAAGGNLLNHTSHTSIIALPGGLSSYLADHRYEEEKGRGWQYRKDLIVDYESYVNPEKEFPLKDFSERDDLSSRAIGYGKGVMLFHMLKNLVGTDSFNSALKGFIKENEVQGPSWTDLRIAFEKTSGKNLEWFFNQWLNRKGIPSIELQDPKVVVSRGIPLVSFEIVQKNEPFKFNLTVIINTDKGDVTQILNIDKERETFEIPVPGNPLEITVDRDYDLMRKLSEEEYPPVISRFLGDDKRLVVIPAEEGEKYADLIGGINGKGTLVKEESEIKDADIKKNSLLILGFDSPILKRLFGGIIRPGSGFTITVKKNPLNPSKVVAIAYADSKEDVLPVAKKLPLYGRYSYLRFERGRNIESDIKETNRGIRMNITEPVIGIQPQKMMKLDDIILNILDKPIIYVGERHTNFEDHRVQLKVITSLQESGRKLAIGMEMFQKPFQKAINDYLSGIIDEREFLRATQYFKRWQFDYNLYREIIEYAKAKEIPVIALNIWSEIVKTVASGGLDALTDSEKAQIPADMDMSDAAYRQRLKEIFETHKNHGSKSFDNLYQAQILWDETMAHSADTFLKKNPDYQMIVLAGVGHIMYGSGIPKRAFRLNRKDYVTLVPGIDMQDEKLGDYILFPEHIPPPDTVKLGVVLKKINSEVKIEKIQPSSIAEKVSLKKGDILISVDGWKIEDVDDVRISLFDKKAGDKIKVNILRKKFLSGYKEFEFDVTL